jgi:hypothetical protein
MARGTVTGLPIFSGDRSVNLTAPTIKAIAQLLKPLKDQAVTIIFGTGAVTGLTIGYDKPALATSQGFDGVTLDYGYPDITKLIPNEFAGLDSEGIILDPAVMGKACKVTPALIKWQLNGALKSVYGTAQDTCGINWQIMVMPCRMI